MVRGKSYSIIGGDLRSVKLAELIAQDGNSVNIYGFTTAGFEIMLEQSKTLTEAVVDADVVIGPIPCSNDNEFINAPFHNESIHINELFKVMNKNQLFLAGRISDKIAHLAQVCNVYTIDLLEREEMAVLNGIPTAEGAIQIAMEEMPITLHNSNTLILGYGRIGKILAKMLHGIGSNVYVEARKYADLAWIKSLGYSPVMLSDLSHILKKIDVIFNTIPSMVLNYELLKLLNPECLIIDLASKPGGVDFNKAKDLGVKAIWALSLPGKVAPVTAAIFIKDTTYNIIEELGV
ncbi:dipicolinate synthase subunit DpsA [Ruminiclostridium cellulolyticum]|uniref:Dipicolinate synthase subunit A n=1 Tax=Ruminiclostridium cellulolyticum (strain ATCC 35319 / DSM 5812 / JCM 6584 / H10) TaxID=394503 RepID=B8I2R3_RUMCH|nr:dipicolinate synthase subunit DpsA [Ruminiclostridium cellulolyticum]ACL76056.1 dipicolinate synthase subunit A [Ruminiclostridium cellulolyticum H10]